MSPFLAKQGLVSLAYVEHTPHNNGDPPLPAALVCVCVECNASVLNMCARLAQTPDGMASGSFGPTTAGRMDSYIDTFQKAGGSMITLAKGNRSR